MYRPAANAVDDPAEAVAIARRHAFGHLVVVGAGGFDSVAVPFLVDPAEGDAMRVRLHVARVNPIWRAAPCDALLIVSPVDAYVSPNWYATKRDGDPRVVPTWNYELVHFHGRVSAHRDPAWLERIVRDLTDLHESALPAPRWSVDDAPRDYVDRMLRAIVGLELTVTRVEAKRKLSQNRSAEDVAGVVRALRDGPARSQQVAAVMEP